MLLANLAVDPAGHVHDAAAVARTLLLSGKIPMDK